jgi:hypothetical protein
MGRVCRNHKSHHKCCESFHAKLNASFSAAHPNIFVLIEILLGIQSEIYSGKYQVEPSQPWEPSLEQGGK